MGPGLFQRVHTQAVYQVVHHDGKIHGRYEVKTCRPVAFCRIVLIIEAIKKLLSFCRYRVLGPTCRYISPSPWISFGPWRACRCLIFTVKDELTILMNNNAACDRCFTKWRPRCSLGRNNASSLWTDWVVPAWLIQCCFTSTETMRLTRDGNLHAQKPMRLIRDGDLHPQKP